MANATMVGPGEVLRRDHGVLRRHWRAAASLILVVVLAGAGLSIWRWQRGLSLLEPVRNEIGGPVSVDRTSFILIGDSITKHTPTTIDVRSAAARIATNTAGASVRVVECVENGRVPTLGYVSHLGFCNDVHPFTPGPMHFTNGLHTALFVLEVRARHPGRLLIHGIELSYRAGIRTGRQATGLNLDFRAKSPNS